jgi:hypothetical protein
MKIIAVDRTWNSKTVGQSGIIFKAVEPRIAEICTVFYFQNMLAMFVYFLPELCYDF